MAMQSQWATLFGLGTLLIAPFPGVASMIPVKESRVERISHAKELLGESYASSGVKATEKEKRVGPFVQALVKKLVSKKDRKLAARISRTILAESERYNFDPLFLVALIQNESAFKVRQIGTVGEIGLMQVRPETAAWIAKKFNLKYKGEKTLFDPASNIRIGTAFLSLLRKQFKKESQLYVSAYNMGARKVRLLVDDESTPTIYMGAVMKRYLALYKGLSKKGDIDSRTKEAFQKLLKATGTRKVAGEDGLVGDEGAASAASAPRGRGPASIGGSESDREEEDAPSLFPVFEDLIREPELAEHSAM